MTSKGEDRGICRICLEEIHLEGVAKHKTEVEVISLGCK